MSLSRSVLAIGIGLLLVTAGAATADLKLGPFAGEWRRVESQPDEPRLESIRAALRELSWVTRTMATPILQRSTTPPDRYEFRVDTSYPDGIALGQRDREPRPLLLDGRETEGVDKDLEVTTSALRREDGIETRWRTSQAHGSTVFRLSNDGTTLVVESLLQVTAISGVEPIRYETLFVRTPAVSSGSE